MGFTGSNEEISARCLLEANRPENLDLRSQVL